MTGSLLQQIAELEQECTAAATAFLARHGPAIDGYRKLISTGIDDALAGVRDHVGTASGGDESAARLAGHLEEYVSWMQWSLWDIPVLAVAMAKEPDEFRDSVVACGLVFIAVRLFDDAIDQHLSYKGRHDTLLGTLSESNPRQANGLSVLAGLLLCFEGLERLAQRDHDGGGQITAVLRSVRNAVVGAIMEFGDSGERSLEEYLRLVRLKNVDYCRSLYASLDPTFSSPLCPFMMGFYELAQFLNDVEDQADDLLLGQPNLVVIHRAGERRREAGSGSGSTRLDVVPAGVEQFIAERFLALGEQVAQLPELEASVARLKLADAFRSARLAGLFAPDGDAVAPAPVLSTPALYPYSELGDVVERVGMRAVSHDPCPICGSAGRVALFRKQGFEFVRCTDCTHIYPEPRLVQDLVAAVTSQADAADESSIHGPHAEHLAGLLLQQSAGGRLLEIGCGGGQFLRAAQLYGFDVVGLDYSSRHVDELGAEFGERTMSIEMADEVIPWAELDVVLLTRVLEHLTEPSRLLAEARGRMNADGLLCVTVAHMAGSSYRLLGKRWDVVNPMTRVQYFTEQSLGGLLRSSGFERIERARLPGPPDEIAPRWVQLVRQAGYDELDELTMLARVPGRGAA
jgi:SAM-dependent methyltransferase